MSSQKAKSKSKGSANQTIETEVEPDAGTLKEASTETTTTSNTSTTTGANTTALGATTALAKAPEASKIPTPDISALYAQMLAFQEKEAEHRRQESEHHRLENEENKRIIHDLVAQLKIVSTTTTTDSEIKGKEGKFEKLRKFTGDGQQDYYEQL